MRAALAALLLLCSCVDDIERRRADLDRAYREQRAEMYEATCERACGREFDWCLRRRGHSAGACSQQYNDCARECAPKGDDDNERHVR